MRDYLRAQVADKRTDPGDDLTSALVHYQEDGDRLDADELIAQLQTIYIAGHEPVTAVLGNGMHGLLARPGEFERLWSDRTLVPGAVQELLRFDGPNQFVRRVAVQDLDFDGGTVPAGAVVYPCIGAADHDPDEFGTDADTIRIDRPEAVHHLQFGAGIHSCLGTHLARLELEVTLERLIGRFASLEVVEPPTWSPRHGAAQREPAPSSLRARRRRERLGRWTSPSVNADPERGQEAPRRSDSRSDAVRSRAGAVAAAGDPNSTLASTFFAPLALQETVLAVWLIVKGFDSTALASRSSMAEPE